MDNPPTSSGKGSRYSKGSLRAEARLRISKGLRRRATSPIVTAKAPRLASTLRSNDGDQRMLDELRMEQESSPSDIDSYPRRATSPMVAEEAPLLVALQLPAHSGDDYKRVSDEFRMEQASSHRASVTTSTLTWLLLNFRTMGCSRSTGDYQSLKISSN